MSSHEINDALAWAATCHGGAAAENGPSEIRRGGSARKFFRLELREGPAVLVVSDGCKPENALYGPLARWLGAGGIPVPRVLAEEPARGWLLLEDLGEADLWSLRDKPWEERSQGYKSALRSLFRLHHEVSRSPEGPPVELMPAFDDSLYAWEQDYFLENALGGLLDWNLESARRGALKAELAKLRERLLDLPTCLVHRDCQSQNIFMRGPREAVFIDFQGMRKGVRFYDLGSLLHDPYVRFYRSQREELLRFYHGLEKEKPLTWKVFASHYSAAASQRLMQALGAYGKLGLTDGKTAFLSHVAPALANLSDTARAPSLEVLGSIAREALARWPERAAKLGAPTV